MFLPQKNRRPPIWYKDERKPVVPPYLLLVTAVTGIPDPVATPDSLTVGSYLKCFS